MNHHQKIIIDAIVLAGGKMEESLKEYSDACNKCFITIAGKLMVSYVIEVLKKVETIRRIILASPLSILPKEVENKVDLVAPEGETMMKSLRSAILCMGELPDLALVVPGDMPLITPEAVRDFLDKSLELPVDITYSYLSKEDSIAKFPNVRHTYVKTREGTFCGTGLFLIKPQLIDACENLFKKFADNRKNPLGLAGILGLDIIFKLITKAITIPQLEHRILQLMGGCSGRAIRTRFAEAGFNVDAPNELLIARKILEKNV